MSEDEKLLMLAAKAEGREPPCDANGIWSAWVGTDVTGHWWNPLENDGDALRLAVKLDISLRLDGDELTGIAHWRRNGKTYRVVGNYRTGNGAEARRLIVRAAAEIGKATA